MEITFYTPGNNVDIPLDVDERRTQKFSLNVKDHEYWVHRDDADAGMVVNVTDKYDDVNLFSGGGNIATLNIGCRVIRIPKMNIIRLEEFRFNKARRINHDQLEYTIDEFYSGEYTPYWDSKLLLPEDFEQNWIILDSGITSTLEHKNKLLCGFKPFIDLINSNGTVKPTIRKNSTRLNVWLHPSPKQIGYLKRNPKAIDLIMVKRTGTEIYPVTIDKLLAEFSTSEKITDVEFPKDVEWVLVMRRGNDISCYVNPLHHPTQPEFFNNLFNLDKFELVELDPDALIQSLNKYFTSGDEVNIVHHQDNAIIKHLENDGLLKIPNDKIIIYLVNGIVKAAVNKQKYVREVIYIISMILRDHFESNPAAPVSTPLLDWLMDESFLF